MLNQVSQQKAYNPSFLQKLQIMLESPDLSQALKWNAKGTAISIMSIPVLQRNVLPIYFRHNKYGSFVRQLNIYGFGKSKNEKGAVASFAHPFFMKDMVDISKISKKHSKIDRAQQKCMNQPNLIEKLKINDKNSEYTEHHSETGELLSAHQNIINTQKPTNTNIQTTTLKLKQGHQNKIMLQLTTQLNKQVPRIIDLLEQLDQQISSITEEMEILRFIAIDQILRESRYTQVRSLFICKHVTQEGGIGNLDSYIIGDTSKIITSFDEMEFII